MVNATIWEENRHVVLRQPLDALKIKNYRTFTATELVDVQAAADVLTTIVLPHCEDDTEQGMSVIA